MVATTGFLLLLLLWLYIVAEMLVRQHNGSSPTALSTAHVNAHLPRSSGTDEPVAEIVPNTQPSAFARDNPRARLRRMAHRRDEIRRSREARRWTNRPPSQPKPISGCSSNILRDNGLRVLDSWLAFARPTRQLNRPLAETFTMTNLAALPRLEPLQIFARVSVRSPARSTRYQ
jgi:hypothetical protein